MTVGRRWRVRLAPAATNDIQSILQWTTSHFGEAQARVYAGTLNRAIEALEAGPDLPGAKARDDIAKGLMSLHVARQGRKGRHLVFYRTGSPEQPPTVDVLRLLHDSMDPARHLPLREPDNS